MEKQGNIFVGKYHGIGKIVEKEINFYEDLTIEEFKSEPVTVLNLCQKTYKDDKRKIPMHLEMGIIKIFPAEEV